MNFFVLLSVVKTLQNYTLYTHRRTFSLSRTYSYKENHTENKQFFLLAIRAQQKDSKIFSPTYLINIQPSCSLNGFSASNQTLHTKKDRIHQRTRGYQKESREIVCVHAKGKESKSSLPYLLSKFSLSSEIFCK